MALNKIAIAGAGTMGYSIAEIFAEYDYDVILYDISQDAVTKAKESMRIDTRTLISEKGLSDGEVDALLDRISCTSVLDDLLDADIVIECIIENMEIKHAFYRELCQIVLPDTIIATNTSGLSINLLAEAVTNPERFIGMHWFNPSNLVLLIEIIKGDRTDDQVAKQINDLCLSINKKPVIVDKDVPGFVANRIQFAILREVLDLVEKGVVSPEGVDDIMKYGLGFRYACTGPLEVADFGGLDTFYHISEYLMKDLCSDKDVPKALAEHYKKDEYGVKSGKGFYDYSGGRDESAVMDRNKKLVSVFKALYSDR